MPAKKVIFVASVARLDARGVIWREYFGAPRVPVLGREPSIVIFPNGSHVPCYLIDFSMKPVDGPGYKERLMECFKRRGGQPDIMLMVASNVYPIVADGVTVTEADASFFPSLQPADPAE